MENEEFICPPHLVKTRDWINANCRWIPDWDWLTFLEFDSNVKQFEEYCALSVMENCKKNLRHALCLICRGFIDRLSPEMMEAAIATGLVSPVSKTMYSFAYEAINPIASVLVTPNGTMIES
jgi:hypothetical protein